MLDAGSTKGPYAVKYFAIMICFCRQMEIDMWKEAGLAGKLVQLLWFNLVFQTRNIISHSAKHKSIEYNNCCFTDFTRS